MVFQKIEVEKVFNEVFDQKVPQSELEIFIKKLFVIMNNHVEDLVNQIKVSAYNEPNVEFISGNSANFSFFVLFFYYE